LARNEYLGAVVSTVRWITCAKDDGDEVPPPAGTDRECAGRLLLHLDPQSRDLMATAQYQALQRLGPDEVATLSDLAARLRDPPVGHALIYVVCHGEAHGEEIAIRSDNQQHRLKLSELRAEALDSLRG